MIEIDKTTGKGTFTFPRIGFMPEIERVIFNDPATVVFWKDGGKTVVKCQEGDSYNEQTGLLMCIAKRYFGNTGRFNDVLHEWVPYAEKVEPSFDWEAFRSRKVAVNCKTKEAAKDFMEEAGKHGFRWSEWNEASFGAGLWIVHKEGTCYSVDCINTAYLCYCHLGYYRKEGMKIIEWKPTTE